MKSFFLLLAFSAAVRSQLFETLGHSAPSFLQAQAPMQPFPQPNLTSAPAPSLPKFIETGSAFDRALFPSFSSAQPAQFAASPAALASQPADYPSLAAGAGGPFNQPQPGAQTPFQATQPAQNPGLYNEFLNENHGGAPLPDFIKDDIQPRIFREPPALPSEDLDDRIQRVLGGLGISISNRTLTLDPELRLRVRNSSFSLRELEALVAFNSRLMRKCGANLEFCMIKDNALDEELAADLAPAKGKGMNFLEVAPDEAESGELEDLLSPEPEDADAEAGGLGIDLDGI